MTWINMSIGFRRSMRVHFRWLYPYKAINRLITIFHFAMFSCLQRYSRHLITYWSAKYDTEVSRLAKKIMLRLYEKKLRKFYWFKNCLLSCVSIINIYFKLKLGYIRIYSISLYRGKRDNKRDYNFTKRKSRFLYFSRKMSRNVNIYVPLTKIYRWLMLGRNAYGIWQ